MTDGQPGQNQAGAAAEGNAQDTGFNVTFDEGNAGQQGADGGNTTNSEGANNGFGEGNDNTGTTDAFAWVPEDYREEFRNDSTLNQFASQDAFIKAMLDDAHISSHVDARNEKLGYRMREAQIKKIPVQIVIGDGEVENRTVTVRRHGSQDKVTMPLNDFLSMLQAEIEEKR